MGQGSSCDLSCENLHHERPSPPDSAQRHQEPGSQAQTECSWDSSLNPKVPTDHGGQRGLFCYLPSQTPSPNKARFVSAEHSYSNWENLSLNEAVGKTNPRTAAASTLPTRKISAIRRVFKKNSPEGTAYLTARWFANAQANTPAGK